MRGSPLGPPFSLLLSFLLISCHSGHDGAKLHIEKGDSLISFELSPESYGPHNANIYRGSDRTYFVNNNYSLYDTVNQLVLYDIESERAVHRTEVIPDTFGYHTKINEYQYLGHDSIFFTLGGAEDPWNVHFVLIDSSSRMLNRWNVDGSTEKAPDFRTGGNIIFPPIHYRDRRIYSNHLVEGPDLDGSVFNTAPMAMIHLLDSGETRFERFGRYPAIYLKGDRKYLPDRSVRKLIPYPLNLYDYAIGNGQLVLSFPACDTLYRYDLEGRFLGKKAVESEFASPQDLWTELRKKGAAIKKDYEQGFTDLPHYTSLTYDPHRDLYYRMISFGERWGLMVLSKELELMEEIELDKEGPFLSTPTPTKDQVLIGKNQTEDLVFFPLRIERKKGSASR